MKKTTQKKKSVKADKQAQLQEAYCDYLHTDQAKAFGKSGVVFHKGLLKIVKKYGTKEDIEAAEQDLADFTDLAKGHACECE